MNTKNQFAVGMTVKYANPVDADEVEVRFTLIELNGDRCFIRLQDARWGILAPIELVKTSDIEIAE